MDILLLIFALFGHVILWTATVNRSHSLPLPHRVGRRILYACAFFLVAIPPAILIWSWTTGRPILGRGIGIVFPWPGLLDAYLVLCWCLAAMVIPTILWRQFLARPPAVVRTERKRAIHVLEEAEGPGADGEYHLLIRLPGNESLKLDIVERGVEIADLAPELEGVTIAHLSDWHFTGRVPKTYFKEIVRLCNDHEPDLIVVTGDLLDNRDCLDWVPETFGALRARCGVYYILGNHDLRVGVSQIRNAMDDCGLVNIAGRWESVTVNGQPVILAGNEMPWIPPAANMSEAPARRPDGPLRIGLSHSPDELRWAQENDFDLLFAGHLHGGQIRFPLLGPLLAPSRLGVKYASGIFHLGRTVLQVSRGLSGEFPIRLNCPPELIFMTLHGA